MNTITQSLKIILLAVVLSLGISHAFAWVSPTVAPTGGNDSMAPLNTSNNDQVKNGNLFLNALGVTNTAPNALSVLGGGYFGGDIEVANGSGITLGGVKKTVWPSGSATADWNTITNRPAGFADNVDNNSFGGGFKVDGTCSSGDYFAVCATVNPATGSCTCPAGFTSLNVHDGTCNALSGLPPEGGYICFKN